MPIEGVNMIELSHKMTQWDQKMSKTGSMTGSSLLPSNMGTFPPPPVDVIMISRNIKVCAEPAMCKAHVPWHSISHINERTM